MDEQVRIMIDKWRGKLGEFDICNDITLLSMDIICETSMGVSIKAQTNANTPYYVAVRKWVAKFTEFIKGKSKVSDPLPLDWLKSPTIGCSTTSCSQK